MPQPIPKQFKLGLIEPRDAAEFFERKGWLLPSFRWQDTFREEHARGVAVAGVMKLDVLQAFADELQATINAGGDLRSFSQRMQVLLEKKGFWGDVEITDPRTGELRTTKFDKRRLQLIFDVNARQAFAAGRWKRIEQGKERKPFVMYMTMNDERVRISHRPWHGLVLPVDHPFWRTHYPPNGWRCRCTAFAVSEKDIARYRAAGVPVKRDAPEIVMRPWADRHNGRTLQVPAGIDPGFDYNPGQRQLAGVVQRELEPGVLQYPLQGAAQTLARLPAPRPVAASMLLPGGWSDEEYLAAFVQMFGGSEVFTDVTGERLLINEEFFKQIKGNINIKKNERERYIRLMALTLQQPDEIWMAPMQHVARGKAVIRRRYIARFAVEGETKPVLGIVELGSDGWRGVTGYQAFAEGDAERMLRNDRAGEWVYARVK